MAAYLEEVRKLEKHFRGMGLMHIPRKENQEADDIANRASRRQAQQAGVFEERLVKASIKQPQEATTTSTDEALPPPPVTRALYCGPRTGERLLLTAVHQEIGWIDELKDYLAKGILPEEDVEAERIARHEKSYYILEVDLYRKRPNGNALKCVPPEEGRRFIKDIHSGECGYHLCARTLTGKVFRRGFNYSQALQDAVDMVQACEACQFHAKQIHQPALGLQTIPLSWPFAVWGLDI